MQVSHMPVFAGKKSVKSGLFRTAALAAALAVPAQLIPAKADAVQFSVIKVVSPTRFQERAALETQALELGQKMQTLNRNFQTTLFEIYRDRAQYGDAEFQAETERILPEMLAEHAALGMRMQLRELRFQEQIKTARSTQEARAIVRNYMDEVANRFFAPVESTVNQVHRFSSQRNMAPLVEKIQPLKAEVEQNRRLLEEFESAFGPE